MEFLFPSIITKQSRILCVTILSKHFCIFLKHGKELKGKDGGIVLFKMTKYKGHIGGNFSQKLKSSIQLTKCFQNQFI
jgi:hypothetical protein